MELELEPWEALDLDDSDLPSLLRPCKRRRSVSPASSPATVAAAAENPHLQPAPEQLDQPPLASSSRRRAIPGPAGAVHAAMLRKYHDSENHNSSGSNHEKGNDRLLSTQDYIRKAMDDTAEFDDDFSRHPWLSALQFLGAEDGLIPSTPISSIKKCFNGDKVVQVVAVVKSCTPNGLGGLLVSLKDPTGTIGASVHNKVLSQSEFGKEITIGAVLILQKVAIFAPVRSAHYLNVTKRNLVKVFCQNKGSTSELHKFIQPVQYADPDMESTRRTREVEKMSSMQNMVREDTEMRHCTRTEKPRNDNAIQRQNPFAGSSRFNNREGSNLTAAQREGYTNLSQRVCNEGPEDMMRTRIAGDNQEIVNGIKRCAKGATAETSGEKGQGTNEVQTQRQPLTSTATLPHWTDEQLDELFAGDEDDGSLS